MAPITCERGIRRRSCRSWQGSRLRGQDGDAGRATLHCLPQSSGGGEGHRRSRRDLATLERQLAKGDKAPVGNTGFRRYLKTISDEHFAIDRTAKHLLATRPIFHKLDETIRGHVFCGFLALVLKKGLEDRIAALARSGS
jgi:hypothetical protein